MINDLEVIINDTIDSHRSQDPETWKPKVCREEMLLHRRDTETVSQ
jgi:hypothetical protein